VSKVRISEFGEIRTERRGDSLWMTSRAAVGDRSHLDSGAGAVDQDKIVCLHHKSVEGRPEVRVVDDLVDHEIGLAGHIDPGIGRTAAVTSGPTIRSTIEVDNSR